MQKGQLATNNARTVNIYVERRISVVAHTKLWPQLIRTGGKSELHQAKTVRWTVRKMLGLGDQHKMRRITMCCRDLFRVCDADQRDLGVSDHVSSVYIP